MAQMYDDSPIHPILENAHEFVIVRLDYHNDPHDWRNSYLELHLHRGEEVRRLRFLRPRSLVIEEGFPCPTHGIVILDVEQRQWDDIKVEVTDFEASAGRVSFYASEVIDLDSM